MAIPVFVGAGTGLEILVAGTQTVSKTGCTAGNFVMAWQVALLWVILAADLAVLFGALWTYLR